MMASLRAPLFLRLALAFGVVLVVSVAVLALGTILPLRRSVERAAIEELQAATDLALAEVQQHLHARCDEIRSWAAASSARPEPGPRASAEDRPALLGRLRDNAAGAWIELLFVDQAGRVVASSGRPAAGGFVEIAIPSADRIEEEDESGCALVVNDGDNPVLIVSHQVPGPREKPLRLAGIAAWQPLGAILERSARERDRPVAGALTLLLDEKGRILAGDREALDRLPGAETVALREEPRGASRRRLAEESDYLIARTDLLAPWPGAPAVRLVAFLDWRAAIGDSGGRPGHVRQTLFLGVVAVAAAAFLLTRGLSARMNRLIDGCRRLAAGDRSVRVADGHDDEIGDLERAFDELATELDDQARSVIDKAGARRTEEIERRAASLEEALRQSRSSDATKAEFLANVSHEIRTPLNGIIGMTALALDADLPSEARGHLNLVKTSADALLDLINDILDFSKIERRRLTLQPMAFRLRPGLEDALAGLADRASQKGLRLDHHIDEAVPDSLIGDPGRLRQILVSLIGNAIKFTERGRIDVEVALEGEDGCASTLHFAVRDTGIGIPPEKQGLIFEPFTQADGSSTRRHGGIGLGLAIASQLVGLMRGRLWVESGPGHGSAFHFTARFERAPAELALEMPAAPAQLRGVRVLLVDDNPINRRLLESRLKAWGMRPDVAEDGRQALASLSRAAQSGAPYQLAVLDVQMPGLDGFSVAAEVKGHPQLAATRLLLLTSAGQRGDATRCREIGLEGYLTKPAREAELRDALLSILSAPARISGAAPLITRHALRERSRPSGILIPDSDITVPQAAGRSDLPTLDSLDLLARVDGDRGLLSELVRAFITTAPQQLAAMDAALERGEGAALSRAAHTLKGSVGTFAAPRALRAADRVESLGRAGDLRAAGAARRELGAEIERLSQALLPYLSRS